MYTYLGIDNTQKSRLTLVCKIFKETGQIELLWSKKLQGEREIAYYFARLPALHWPTTFCTTCVTHDPGGVLDEHVRHGGLLIRYYPWELSTDIKPISGGLHRANLLATQAIKDQQYPVAVRAMQRQLSALQSKIGELLFDADQIDRKFEWMRVGLGLHLPHEYLVPQIPF